MYPNLKHRQLQNGSDTSQVGFLRVKKQLRPVCPQADKSSSVSHRVMDDDWWRKRGSEFVGLSWLKHISNYECQPLGSVNPHLELHTTPVTLLVPRHISTFEAHGGRGPQVILTGVRWEVASGGVRGQCTGGYERYFGCRMARYRMTSAHKQIRGQRKNKTEWERY